jgi:hypothetical protein
MRKARFIFLAGWIVVIGALSCSTKKSVEVERSMENGVEVVLNHLQPYTVPGYPFVLELEEELVIDTEDEAVANTGLTDIGSLGSNSVEADAEVQIYLLCPQAAEGQILKFTSNGTFLTAFAPKGQGPGEFQSVSMFTVYPGPDGEDEISVAQQSTCKVAFFRTDGTLITERKAESALKYVRWLKEDRFLIWTHVLDGSGKFLMKHPLLITDSDFQPVSELDIQNVPNPMSGERMKGFYYILSWAVSGDRIFTGFQDRDYEIRVYDADGRLVRLIRKDYRGVSVPEEHKRAFMSQFENPMFDSIRDKIYFPETMPPFIGFISDEDGRLFVLTYEEGNNPGEKMVDVFDDNGVFVGRRSLRLTYDEFGVHARIKNSRLYAVEEKESGFKRLVVSRIRLSLPQF